MAAQSVQIQPHLVTIKEYEQMIRAGVFSEDERIELIEGQMINIAAQALLSVQNPIRLFRSEPQPDLALLKPRSDDYGSGHPTAREVLLVIEVADTSADYDRNVKIPLYGRSGIPEAWLINLSGHAIEVYRQPGKDGYSEKKTYASGDQLAPLALPDINLAVAGILGAAA